MEHVQRLKGRLAELNNIGLAGRVLGWDQATYMPRGGAAARAEQIATLGALAHRATIAPEMGRLLEAAEREVEAANLDADDDARCLVKAARRDYTLATKLPTELVEELARTGTLAYEAWVAAREADDFAAFAPWLEQSFELARRQAEYLGYKEHIYDALLDLFEPGMTAAQLDPLFAELRAGLVPLLRAISARLDAVDDTVLHQAYDEAVQLRLSEEAARLFGFDFARGRLDLTVHPFATSFSIHDVRLTTRVDPAYLPTALLGTMHETGHGLYEQNVGENLEGTPLANAASLGWHESQSRLWENVVGRSCGFWEYFFSVAQRAFPQALAEVDAETVYRALNKVDPTLVRIEADEVSYNLHIMLRFELEKELLTGRLAVRDLPEAWNAASREYLGVTPPRNALGVMQDVHWSSGLIGYFPTYSIGSVLSVQLYEMAVQAHPAIPDEIRRGECGTLLAWLREHVCQHGRKYEPADLTLRATGRPLEAGPYLRYLREKFGALYGVQIDEAGT